MQRLPGDIFQQYNARPHTERVSLDCLGTVTTLPWPARYPEFSPIEHIWDHLGWRVGNSTSLMKLEARMDENCTTKKVFNAQPIGTRRKGRPSLRWIDGLEKDFLVLRTKNWRTLAGRMLACGKDFLRRPRLTLDCRTT
ncbi:transposable element Tcb2 transposase [Trichonephila clavipes]|uniref:Transposable element Tcb2 transposase n=1 Tax=Trichonephila clavipes TaxID=2585209 RepID=A0A8X6SHI1_TRICX|nr:transposable element Tcb2 transposase [Trichonephila clavipes]